MSKADLVKADTVKSDLVKSDTAKIDTAKSDLAKVEAANLAGHAADGLTVVHGAARSRRQQTDRTGKAQPSPVIASPIPEVMAPTSPDRRRTKQTAPKVALQRTEFGVDLGTANSVPGLRALWRGLLKSRSNAPLAALRPIIVIKEGTNGLGMQLRLVAGPLNDAGAAARICAVLTENKRTCETAIFDGQRLSLTGDRRPRRKPNPRRAASPSGRRPWSRSRRRSRKPPATTQTGFSSLFGKKANNLLATKGYAKFLIRLPANGWTLVPAAIPDHIAPMKKSPFRLTPYQVQFLLVVGFVTVGYALYLRYLAVEFSTVALACDAGLQTMICKSRTLATYLFKNSVFGIVALIIAVLHVHAAVDRAADRRADRGRARDRALQYRAVGDCDRAAYFGICAARARHSVSASRKIDRAGPHRLPVLRAFVEADVERGRPPASRQRRIRRSGARPPSAG